MKELSSNSLSHARKLSKLNEQSINSPMATTSIRPLAIIPYNFRESNHLYLKLEMLRNETVNIYFNNTKLKIRKKEEKDRAFALYLQQFRLTIFTGVTMGTDRLTKTNLGLRNNQHKPN